MRYTILGVILLLSSPLLAQQPATPELTIFLAPLKSIGEDGKTAWISQSVQQNLLNDLTRLQGVRPILPIIPPADHDVAIKDAKAAGATFLIEGSYTLADPGLRITLQFLDLRTSSYIGAAKSTGPLRDLFALEDSIADQIKRIIITQQRLAAPPLAQPPIAADIAIKPDGPVQEQYPWDRDKPFIAHEIRKTLLDRDYEDSRYRTTYTYPSYGAYYGYGYTGYYSYGGFYRPYAFGPRPIFRGSYYFPNGFISVRW